MIVQDWLGVDNQIGIDIWHKKYQRDNETFEEWVNRVSGGDKNVADLIIQKKFLFGGRILSNRGVDDAKEKVTYSNCYVISPPEDSIESIYETCSKLARTYSYGGGCGIDISKLAPEGARVRNQAKKTTGAVSFMDTFSQVTGTIGQNGRRGALMISLDCKHPDLEKFITIKEDLSKVNYANISVRMSDDFMCSVRDDNMIELEFRRPETKETISKRVRAKDIFRLICEQNWKHGEPGILFWDMITGYNLLANNPEFEYAGVNPCSEEPLPAGGSCLLGALNLAAFVDDKGRFNDTEFGQAVHVAVKALNDVLDDGLEKHPLQEQRDSVRKWRQIGLGIMGLADMLIKMGIKYGSMKSIGVCDRIGRVLIYNALRASSELAREFGSYPMYDDNVMDTRFFINHSDDRLIASVECYGLRNSQLLTIAPTGTISTMLGISGGIEPIFANSYNRLTKSLHGEDVSYKVYTPIVKEYMERNKIQNEKDLPEYFVTAADISIDDRISMQSIWQYYIDAGISSTINLPNTATVEDIEKLYLQAWEKGLKGVTVFRSGCDREGILTTTEGKDTTPTPKPIVEASRAINEGVSHRGLERHLNTGCGTLHVCAYFDSNGDLKNTYLSKGSSGGCQNHMIGLSRMMSLAARNGVDIHSIVDQLNSCGVCPSYAVRKATKNDVSPGSCCPVAVGKALIDMWNEVNKTESDKVIEFPKNKCPSCGEAVISEGGCVICKSCGWSKCD